jgi:hypothetical protein
MTLIDNSVPLEIITGVANRQYTGVVRLSPGPGISYGEDIGLEFLNGSLTAAYAINGKYKELLPMPLVLNPTEPFYYNVEFSPGKTIANTNCGCGCVISHGEVAVPNRSSVTFGELFTYPLMSPAGWTARELESQQELINAMQIQYTALLNDYTALQDSLRSDVVLGSPEGYGDDIERAISEVLGCG